MVQAMKKAKTGRLLIPHQRSTWVLAVALSACAAEVEEPEEPTPTPVLACDPALTIAPDAAEVEPRSVVLFTAAGGSGTYRFALEESGSGGEIQTESGAYLAGATAGVDRVVVRDVTCSGEAFAEIEVLAPLEVAPTSTWVPPVTDVVIEVVGGSGDWSCSLAVDGSGGTLSDGCAFRAGALAGLDVIRVTDAQTAQFADVRVVVDPDAALHAAGEGGLHVVEGSPAAVRTVGGSGEVTLSVEDGAIALQDGRIVAGAGAAGTVRVSDRYSPELSLLLPVRGVGAFAPDVGRDGERSGHGVLLGLGDVNGDNLPDAAFGFIEPSVDAYYSGAVALYAGNGSGYEPAPARVLGGTERTQTFGRSLAAADLDGDGLVDLLVGADKTDRGVTNNGALFIYPGVSGQFFADEPARVLYGRNAYARFGAAVTVCDFDADGWLDLAVGAIDDIDEAVAVPAEGQGAVHVFRGAETGFDDEASFLLHGVLPDGLGGFLPGPGMHLGGALASGDFDGDGLCDLAVGAASAPVGDDAEAGLVYLYRGTQADDALLAREPALMLAGAGSGELGRRIALGDVDGDGRMDLLAAEWGLDGDASAAGAVRLLRGRAIADVAGGEWVDAEDADWSVRGTSSFERAGSDIALADLDDDGRAEVVVGAYRAELGFGVNEGVIRV